MLDFRFIKEVNEKDGGVTLKRLFHASSYQGGILLRTTTILGKSISSNITNLPMAEIYETVNYNDDGCRKLDIRMVNFCLQQVGVDLGFDLTPPVNRKETDIMTSECKE